MLCYNISIALRQTSIKEALEEQEALRPAFPQSRSTLYQVSYTT